jgi:hypothetical protein
MCGYKPHLRTQNIEIFGLQCICRDATEHVERVDNP